jgi:hypothetical protein
MQMLFTPGGKVRCLYEEAIDLKMLGPASIARASYVEADELGQWHADLAAVGGPVLGPFPWRSEALLAERRWLEDHWLTASGG